ncbi:MAG: hypothetical protein KatS3mg042_1494 [Rhodothermaceae bacterium]|nr:MAG: hypothetical protein KatS3mg042_1494 [Rhodothermaceae bacterium]
MLDVRILEQPDDVTCGPTSLHAVYTYFGLHRELQAVIRSVNYLEEGGTLAVYLGLDALRHGFTADIHSYNLKILDPSWATLPRAALVQKLRDQLRYKHGKKFTAATEAYIAFLEAGGNLLFDDLTPELLRSYFDHRLPILAGLSATYLYNCPREYTSEKKRTVYDDLRGEPVGHFVVLCGMEGESVIVADPYTRNPISGQNYYKVAMNRLLNAIMLGVVTYDANLLIISPDTIA